MEKFSVNKWVYSEIHNQGCQIIDAQTIWGETICRKSWQKRDYQTIINIAEKLTSPRLLARRPQIAHVV